MGNLTSMSTGQLKHVPLEPGEAEAGRLAYYKENPLINRNIHNHTQRPQL